jgi:hypothetical protein
MAMVGNTVASRWIVGRGVCYTREFKNVNIQPEKIITPLEVDNLMPHKYLKTSSAMYSCIIASMVI